MAMNPQLNMLISEVSAASSAKLLLCDAGSAPSMAHSSPPTLPSLPSSGIACRKGDSEMNIVLRILLKLR
ncbi:hypothetical protein CEXT_674241 [Caerostris extrusa]|uniref:Uncharacterized protein n=1 Tax=Caerostris extrusa TaxID=172846 RepID=A0AAV4XU21_CAEEX|nr:hypothetical protein CEXT_674241 [Caerostris extrusa]